MRILFFTLGTEVLASSRTRVYQYLRHLRRQGIEYRVINYFPGRHCQKVSNLGKESLPGRLALKLYNLLKAIVFLAAAPAYDLLFIQRVVLPLPLQRAVFLINKRVVFDFDDAIFLDRRPSARGAARVKRKFILRLDNMLKRSCCLIVENGYNRDYARRHNNNIISIAGPIDTQRYRPAGKERRGKRVVLGWIGSPATSFYLEPLYGVFEALGADFSGLALKLIGFPPKMKPQIKGVEVLISRWSLETEAAELAEFDVGLMPLNNDQWSRGKGGYKLLQYMALGIPCVASPVGINKKIVREGRNGFLADNPREWRDKLSLLIKDVSLREGLGAQGRQMAQDIYSYEVNAPRLLAAFNGRYSQPGGGVG